MGPNTFENDGPTPDGVAGDLVITDEEIKDRYIVPAIEAMKDGSYPPFMTAHGATMADLAFGPGRLARGLPFHGRFTNGRPHS